MEENLSPIRQRLKRLSKAPERVGVDQQTIRGEDASTGLALPVQIP